MISFQNTTVKYPLGNKALDRVSFDIEENEFVYLVGPSGAGKTTILKLILNEIQPTEGSITIDDMEISSKKFKSVTKLRQNIGIVFQDFKILPEANVFENVAVSMRIKGFSSATINSEVNNALKTTGIQDKKEMFPAQLSAGEIQRRYEAATKYWNSLSRF